MISRISALGRGAVDRALTSAELAVGVKDAPPPEVHRIGQPHPMFANAAFDLCDPNAIRQVGEDLVKAQRVSGAELLNDGEKPARDPNALDYDPFQFVEVLGFKQRPSGLAYVLLDQMVRRTPAISAVILTRVQNAAQFCQVQEDSHAIGLKVEPRDPEARKRMTKAVRAECARIERAIMNTTFGEPGVGRDYSGCQHNMRLGLVPHATILIDLFGVRLWCEPIRA